jgi:PAS domain-containing protein
VNRREETPGNRQLFEIEGDNDSIVNEPVDEFWHRPVSENRIDIGQKPKKESAVRQRNMVFEEIIRQPDVREIGSEWLCLQVLEQLQLPDYLSNIGFSREETRLAVTQIIGRAVYPAPEQEIARWIRENPAACELTGYPIKKIMKDKLYKSSLKLFSEKENIERFLSVKTSQLFDIEDKIYLYDLTGTYFEGRKERSRLTGYGRSKEKRSDCKVVILVLVINPEFIKYSTVFEGNMQDYKRLEGIVKNLCTQTSTSGRAVVVIDAGIATKENPGMLAEHDFDYVCVSQCRIIESRLKWKIKRNK